MLAGNIKKLCTGAIIAAASCGVFAEVPVDKITVLNLPPATPYRLYLSDMAISHFFDSKLEPLMETVTSYLDMRLANVR